MAIDIKRLLSNALIELSDEKPLGSVTVKDIIGRAGTGRQTFYNHFKDKNDLIYYIFLRTLAGERHLVETQGYSAYLINLYREAQKNRHFFMQACKLEGQNSLSEAIVQQTYKYYKRYIIENYGVETMTEKLKFALMFNAHGASRTYIHWAEMKMPGSADEQAQYALHCMPASIKKYLPIESEDLME